MVLADLGGKLTNALRKARLRCCTVDCRRARRVLTPARAWRALQMGQSARVDEEAMEACLKEVTKALLEVRGALAGMSAPACLSGRRELAVPWPGQA